MNLGGIFSPVNPKEVHRRDQVDDVADVVESVPVMGSLLLLSGQSTLQSPRDRPCVCSVDARVLASRAIGEAP